MKRIVLALLLVSILLVGCEGEPRIANKLRVIEVELVRDDGVTHSEVTLVSNGNVFKLKGRGGLVKTLVLNSYYDITFTGDKLNSIAPHIEEGEVSE